MNGTEVLRNCSNNCVDRCHSLQYTISETRSDIHDVTVSFEKPQYDEVRIKDKS